MYQIKNPWTQTVLFECELPADVAAESPAKQLGWAIKKARESGANLSGADLRGGKPDRWHSRDCPSYVKPAHRDTCQDETATEVNGRWICHCPGSVA